MEPQHLTYLEKANGAISRRDYLSAVQYAMKAAHVSRGSELIRCDAYLLLALTTLEMELPREALAYAVGAHFAARRSRDPAREERAEAMIAMVVAQHPYLGEENPARKFH
jgi:hypothetical protein